MRQEWKTYFKEIFSRLKYLGLTLIVALPFYIVEIPKLHGGIAEHFAYFKGSLMFSLNVFFFGWITFALIHAFQVWRKIKTGTELKIPRGVRLTIGFACMFSALFYSVWQESNGVQDPSLPSAFLNSLLIGTFIFMMFQFYFMFKHEKVKNSELKAAQATAELHVFKNQMQPHFLFNSLNSLTELMESNQSHAAAMTQNLADLYREILENSKTQMSRIQTELSIVRKYLELEKLRFGDRLKYSIHLNNISDPTDVYVPSLMLQTLVENAIKHGVSQSIIGAEVAVHLRKVEDGYKAEVLNSAAKELPNNGGTGIANTKSRLGLLYGDQHRFQLNVEGDWATASFWFSGEHLETV